MAVFFIFNLLIFNVNLVICTVNDVIDIFCKKGIAPDSRFAIIEKHRTKEVIPEGGERIGNYRKVKENAVNNSVQ